MFPLTLTLSTKRIPFVFILSAPDECAAAGDWPRQVCRGSRGAVWISPDPSPAFPARAPATDGHVPPQYKPARHRSDSSSSRNPSADLISSRRVAAEAYEVRRVRATRGSQLGGAKGRLYAEMLAVFDRAVAPSPEGLRQPSAAGDGSAAGLADRFREARPDAVTVNLGGSGAMAYSSHGQSPLLPRLFGAVDDVFCMFQGTIENVAILKQQYGLSKGANEVNIIIEAYRTLRDRGPYPADQVVRDISGKFAFILYDCSNKSVFMAADADGNVPFYWGVDSDGRLVVSDDTEIVKKACGKSSAPFPKGFFFTTSGGLQSYEHPMNEVKPVPRVDSKGEVCGTTYTVDAKAKKDTSIPRVGSAADWSSQY